jgi:hypothetical protein
MSKEELEGIVEGVCVEDVRTVQKERYIRWVRFTNMNHTSFITQLELDALCIKDWSWNELEALTHDIFKDNPNKCVYLVKKSRCMFDELYIVVEHRSVS